MMKSKGEQSVHPFFLQFCENRYKVFMHQGVVQIGRTLRSGRRKHKLDMIGNMIVILCKAAVIVVSALWKVAMSLLETLIGLF